MREDILNVFVNQESQIGNAACHYTDTVPWFCTLK